MAEIHPDVLAQMKRIHSALNDGTVDRATANDALRALWELLSGTAESEGTESEPVADEGNDGPSAEEDDADPDEGSHKRKTTKKRHR